MKCVIGLGNPGKKYAHTRHNIGFMALDALADRHQTVIGQRKFKCDFATTIMGGEKVLLIQPQTYMNLSGEGVRPLVDYFKVNIADIVVVYDDLDLPAGKIRLRQKGGHGGHNGIRSLIDHLGTKEFKRIRIGIGRPEGQKPVIDYVLQPFSNTEQALIEDAITHVVEATEAFATSSFQEAMNTHNQSQ